MVDECDPELTRGSDERAVTGRSDTHETTVVAATVSCGKKDKTMNSADILLSFLV